MPIFRIRASEQVFYKEDIEAEIAGIIKSGKLKLAREFDERFSSTQKYFANIGKSILEKQQTTLVSPLGG